VSSYTVIRWVSGALRRLLWEDFDADNEIRRIVGSEQAIGFHNPKETAGLPAERLSLWLFRVTENEFLKNQPELRANGATTTRPAPLPVDLHYLVTPFARSGELDHLLLGKTLQVLHDNATTLLRIPLERVAQELRIILARRTLEELTRVWEALQEPYRLSVAYEVSVTEIESLRITDHVRVIDRIAGFDDDPVALAEAG
jgi:Pvc16 N-terminal domain